MFGGLQKAYIFMVENLENREIQVKCNKEIKHKITPKFQHPEKMTVNTFLALKKIRTIFYM